MLFTFLGRTIKLGFQNFFRNTWLSVVTIVILVLTVFLITLLVTLNLVGNQAIGMVSEKVDMDLYFEVGIDSERILEAKNFLESNPKVAVVEYVSPDDALTVFKEKYADNETISQSLTELVANPLPASLVVHAKALADYQDIIIAIDASDFSELIETKDYQDNQVVVNRITEVTDKIKTIGLGISAVFAVISLLVVFNTFRIAIYSHRDELGIMKLVGANNSYIKAPFIIEGVLYAFVATIVTMAIYYPAMLFLAPHVNSFFAGYDFDLLVTVNGYLVVLLAIQFISALAISAISSLIAVGRYLKV